MKKEELIKKIKDKEKELNNTDDLNQQYKISRELADLYKEYFDLTGEVL